MSLITNALDWMGSKEVWDEPQAWNVIDILERVASLDNRILWCAFHEARAVDETECLLSDAIGMGHLRCDIVPKLLIDPPGDTK
jgi:hypothetical protein